MIHVILVDDHELFREALRILLSQDTGISVTATAGDAREAKRVFAEHPSDLAIVDVTLPGAGGIPLVRDLKRSEPHRKVLMLSMHEHIDVVADAMDNGADGYALKSQSPGELLQAIHTVAAGGQYLAPGLELPAMNGAGHILPAGLLRSLSKREREIFDLLIRGDRNHDIAGHLFISVKTVETHRTRINKKLGIHSTTELIRFATLNRMFAG